MNAKGHLSSRPKPWSPLAPDATALNQVQSTFECASGCRVRQSWGYHLCWNEPSVFALMLRRPARAFHLFAPPDTGTPSSCVNEILYLIKLRAACDSTHRVRDMTKAFRLSLPDVSTFSIFSCIQQIQGSEVPGGSVASAEPCWQLLLFLPQCFILVCPAVVLETC